jgi:type II secretory pathway pseudopilin PulG
VMLRPPHFLSRGRVSPESSFSPRESGHVTPVFELLVVIMILSILLGLTVPVMRFATEGRRIREAARQMQTAVTLAKGMAAETGQPAGLMLDVESFPEDPTRLFAFGGCSSRKHRRRTRRYRGGGSLRPALGATRTLLRRFPSGDSAMLRSIVKVGDTFRFQSRDYAITASATRQRRLRFPGPNS